MERLSDAAIEILNDLHTEKLEYNSEYLPLIDAMNKLAEYEDADEDRRLVVLPCKFGTHVWRVFANEIREFMVTSVNSQHGIKDRTLVECFPFLRFIWEDDVGRSIFLSTEDAEKALEAE